jgi:hypothetical protein
LVTHSSRWPSGVEAVESVKNRGRSSSCRASGQEGVAAYEIEENRD